MVYKKKSKSSVQPESRTCVECGSVFEVTVLEKELLMQQFGDSFRIPNRCLPCRRKIRAQRLGQPEKA